MTRKFILIIQDKKKKVCRTTLSQDRYSSWLEALDSISKSSSIKENNKVIKTNLSKKCEYENVHFIFL